ncbi:MAG: FtsW/RodA/SpoVE family cell cycle protein, partial [Rickettsia sp.]
MNNYNKNNEISNNFIKLWWRSTDRQIIISLIILFAFSLMLVTTSGSAVASRIGLEENYFASRQIFYLAAASGLILLFSCLNKKWLRRCAIVGFIASVVLLIAVKFFGYEVKGAVRWINMLGLSI